MRSLDVALIALSPGVNDPTTAQDAIFHLATVLREMLVRDPPAAVHTDDHARRLVAPQRVTHETLVALAFDEVRRAARPHPRVCGYLLESIHVVLDATERLTSDEASQALRHQAELVVAEAERSDVLPEELAALRATYRRKFG